MMGKMSTFNDLRNNYVIIMILIPIISSEMSGIVRTIVVFLMDLQSYTRHFICHFVLPAIGRVET